MISNLTKEELKTDILRNLENEGIDVIGSYALQSFLEAITNQYGDQYAYISEQIDRQFNLKQDDNLTYQLQNMLGINVNYQQNTTSLFIKIKTTNGTSIKDVLSYQTLTNGISVDYKGITFTVNLSSFNYLNQITEEEYNVIADENELEVKQSIVYDTSTSLTKNESFNLTDQIVQEIKDNISLDFTFGPSINTIKTLITNVVKGYIDDTYSYNQLILNEETIKQLVQVLANKQFNNIVYVDKPRGDNSFDVIVYDLNVNHTTVDLAEQTSKLSKILPVYIDQNITEPIYYKLNLTFDIQIFEEKFDNNEFLDYIEKYFETNYKSFDKTDFWNYINKHSGVNSADQQNSLNVDLVIKNITGTEFTTSDIEVINELDDYRIIVIDNVAVNTRS